MAMTAESSLIQVDPQNYKSDRQRPSPSHRGVGRPGRMLVGGAFVESYFVFSGEKLRIQIAGTCYILKIGFWSSLESGSGPQPSLRQFVLRNGCDHYTFTTTSTHACEFKQIFSKRGVLRDFYEDYKPLRKIGQGKNASVFLALHRHSGRQFAIKAFPKSVLEGDIGLYQALENEVTVLRSINSRFFPKFEALYETEKSFYLVTQFVSGITLHNFIETQQIDASISSGILTNIVLGLSNLNRLGIVHRDLKPTNIMVRKDLSVVILDFGLAAFCSQNPIFLHCGTPGFIAPQVLDSNFTHITTKVDIFSLGIVYHLMLMKRFPYKKNACSDMIEMNRQANFDFNGCDYSEIKMEDKWLLKKMLQKNVSDRISTQELWAHLNTQLRSNSGHMKGIAVVKSNEDLHSQARHQERRSTSLNYHLRGKPMQTNK